MNDCEIVKALECCLLCSDCAGCPFVGKSYGKDYCFDKMVRVAIDLINRQKAEIEKWRKSANEWREEVMRLLEEGAEQ